MWCQAQLLLITTNANVWAARLMWRLAGHYRIDQILIFVSHITLLRLILAALLKSTTESYDLVLTANGRLTICLSKGNMLNSFNLARSHHFCNIAHADNVLKMKQHMASEILAAATHGSMEWVPVLLSQNWSFCIFKSGTMSWSICCGQRLAGGSHMTVHSLSYPHPPRRIMSPTHARFHWLYFEALRSCNPL